MIHMYASKKLGAHCSFCGEPAPQMCDGVLVLVKETSFQFTPRVCLACARLVAKKFESGENAVGADDEEAVRASNMRPASAWGYAYAMGESVSAIPLAGFETGRAAIALGTIVGTRCTPLLEREREWPSGLPRAVEVGGVWRDLVWSWHVLAVGERVALMVRVSNNGWGNSDWEKPAFEHVEARTSTFDGVRWIYEGLVPITKREAAYLDQVAPASRGAK